MRLPLLLIGLGLGLGLGCSSPAKPEPARPRTVTTETTVEILDPITFTTGAELAPTSTPILDAVASTLAGNPAIELVAVTARVPESIGDDEARRVLSEQRSRAVIDALVTRGTDAARLQVSADATPSTDDAGTVALAVLRRR